MDKEWFLLRPRRAEYFHEEKCMNRKSCTWNPTERKSENWTWPDVARVIKKLLQCEGDTRFWRYDENVFHWRLDGQQIGKLTQVVRALKFNCTASYRQPIKGFTRLGQFYHIVLCFPLEHGEHDFPYHTSTIQRYKAIVSDLVERLCPGYKLGYYFRFCRQATDDGAPEMHVHLVISAIRYREEDREHVDVFNSLPEKEKPFHTLWFLTDPIHLSEYELGELIEKRWRAAIEMETGREIFDTNQLVTVTGHEGQTLDDRFQIAFYIINQALHTFRDVESLAIAKDDKVVVKYKGTVKVMAMQQRDFVIRYFIEPLMISSVGFRGRGTLNGRSPFAKVTDAATRLAIAGDAEGDSKQFLLDLPVVELEKRALVFRATYDNGDVKQIYRLMKQYAYRDSEREWRRKRKEERKVKMAKRAERRRWRHFLQPFFLKEKGDSTWTKADDDALMEYD